jgi:hypothetical protein
MRMCVCARLFLAGDDDDFDCSIYEIKGSGWVAAEEAIQEVMRTLGVDGTGLHVQSSALFALFLLCKGSREVRAAVIFEGVVERTFSAMQQARFDPELTARAFGFFLVLASEPQVRHDMVQRGGGRALIAGLQHNMTNSFAVGLALRTLSFLMPQVRSPIHEACTINLSAHDHAHMLARSLAHTHANTHTNTNAIPNETKTDGEYAGG